MNRPKSVALIIETSNKYARELLRGIAAYLHENELWEIALPEQERGAGPPPWLERWEGDGVIARIENASMAQTLASKNIPVVDVSAARCLADVPWVEIDETAIGAAAFNHFRERGFERFAFCGEPRYHWSQLRQNGFVQAVEEAGFKIEVYPKHASTESAANADDSFDQGSASLEDGSVESEKRQLAKWLRSLPERTGLLVCYDFKAQQVLDACRQSDIRVPEHVAVLGVDNDEVICDLCTPPLSSVVPAGKRIGYEAARTLDRLMRGESVETLERLIGPVGVVTRQSTDIVAVDDPRIATALRFIQNHHSEGINVDDILKAVPISRRKLETSFRQTVGRTIHQEIMRRRIERICELLHDTDLSLAQIARRLGFQSEEYMSVVFRRAKGVPPGRFRKLR